MSRYALSDRRIEPDPDGAGLSHDAVGKFDRPSLRSLPAPVQGA